MSSNLGPPPKFLKEGPVREKLQKANTNELKQTCIAMGVNHEGTKNTLLAALQSKISDIERWVDEYKLKETQAAGWTSVLRKTFREPSSKCQKLE